MPPRFFHAQQSTKYSPLDIPFFFHPLIIIQLSIFIEHRFTSSTHTYTKGKHQEKSKNVCHCKKEGACRKKRKKKSSNNQKRKNVTIQMHHDTLSGRKGREADDHANLTVLKRRVLTQRGQDQSRPRPHPPLPWPPPSPPPWPQQPEPPPQEQPPQPPQRTSRGGGSCPSSARPA